MFLLPIGYGRVRTGKSSLNILSTNMQSLTVLLNKDSILN